MKFLKFLAVGIIFGITLTKAEVISWFRIYEMFRFQSFHMYGVIGSAVLLGILMIQAIKKWKLRSSEGLEIEIKPKAHMFTANLVGGTIFGLGWALTGACPGPLFILVGNGFTVILVVIAAAMLGTFTYGVLRPKLPH